MQMCFIVPALQHGCRENPLYVCVIGPMRMSLLLKTTTQYGMRTAESTACRRWNPYKLFSDCRSVVQYRTCVRACVRACVWWWCGGWCGVVWCGGWRGGYGACWCPSKFNGIQCVFQEASWFVPAWLEISGDSNLPLLQDATVWLIMGWAGQLTYWYTCVVKK